MTIRIDADLVSGLAGNLGGPNDHINQSRFRVLAALALDPAVLWQAGIQQRILGAAGTLSSAQGRINQLQGVTRFCAARYTGAEASLRNGVAGHAGGGQGEPPWWVTVVGWLPLGGFVGALSQDDPFAFATDMTSGASDLSGIGLIALEAYFKSSASAAQNAFLRWAETDVGPQVADGAVDWLGVAAGGFVAALAAGGLEFMTDTADSNDIAKRAGKSVGVGAAVGICTGVGMALGTLIPIPGVGTFIGGAVGGLVGNYLVSTPVGQQFTNWAGGAGDWTANVGVPAAGKAVGAAVHAVGDVAVGAAKAVTDCASGVVGGIAHVFGF